MGLYYILSNPLNCNKKMTSFEDNSNDANTHLLHIDSNISSPII